MAKRARKPQKLLLEIMAKLGSLEVREKFISGEQVGEIVFGQCLGQRIEINPVPSIVDTVIHEVLHALRPEWTERTVKQQTSKLFSRLSEEEMKVIYQVYLEKAGY